MKGITNFKWRRLVVYLGLFAGLTPAAWGVNVLTYHNDNARTGQNLNEQILTPASVGSTNFGKLFSYTVDGYVYAQPLVVTNVMIPGQGVHDVVYIATEHDSVYAFDANSNLPALWQTSFINPGGGITTATSDDVACGDLVPEVGVTSTPVIDPVTQTIYVSAKTKEVTPTSTNFYCRLHALDITTGAEKFGGPVLILPKANGKGDGNDGSGHITFDALTQLNRAALALNNGLVYMGIASHCDNYPYHGWLIAFGATNLQLQTFFNTTPNGSEGGIWQSGDGPAIDSGNNLYVMTGNGTFHTTTQDYGDSFLKLANSNSVLKLIDYFTPFNQSYLSVQDLDLGSGGPVVLPDAAGSVLKRHLLVGAGKQGTIYLINRDKMSHYKASNDKGIVQSLVAAIGGCFATPAYFNNKLYYVGIGDNMKAFNISNALISSKPSSRGRTLFGFPGATPSVSANGTKDGIVWAVQTDAYDVSGPAILHACNATNVALEIYNSANAGTRDQLGGAVKFAVPTIANGKVYVGTQYGVSVFGLGISSVVANLAGRPEIHLEKQGRGHFLVRANGTTGVSYVLQASTNLLTWDSLQTNSVAANVDLKFDDADAGKLPHRYYRVVKLP